MKRFYAGWETSVDWFEGTPAERPPFDFVYWPDRPTTWIDQKTYACKAQIEAVDLAALYAMLRRVFGSQIVVSFAKERTPDLDAHFEHASADASAVLYVSETEVS